MTAATQTKTAYPRFEYLQKVVNSLRYSQGFYSRLAAQLEELDEYTIQQVESQLPEFKTSLDVIFYLEQY